MHLQTQIEHDLFNYLSPAGKAKVEEHYAALEAENADEEIELGEEVIELMSRPDFVLDEDKLRDQEQDR